MIGLKVRPCLLGGRRTTLAGTRAEARKDPISNPLISRREIVVAGLSPICLCSCCTKRSGWYDKFFAYVLSHLSDSVHELLMPYKSELFASLPTDKDLDVLEIGVGTGTNFELYGKLSPRGRVVGLDPNPEMRQYAEEGAKLANLQNFQFVEGYGEQMPFNDQSFDVAISSLVLCSVPDVPKTLREIQRVLRPDGRFLFVEHVAAEPRTVTRFLQNTLNPVSASVQQVLADGCHLNRETLNAIEAGSFGQVDAKTVKIPGMLFFNPVIIGSATV